MGYQVKIILSEEKLNEMIEAYGEYEKQIEQLNNKINIAFIPDKKEIYRNKLIRLESEFEGFKKMINIMGLEIGEIK